MSGRKSLLEDVEAFLHHQGTARDLSPHTLRAYTGDLVELSVQGLGSQRQRVVPYAESR